MARGGPTIGGAWAEGYSRARENAIAETRYRLAEGLRIQRELRANEEAVARETLNMRKNQALAEQAQTELRLLQEREAQIQASPGKPYQRGAATQGQIFEARERLDDATERVQAHQAELQRLFESRDERIRGGATPGRFPWSSDTPFSELPGAPGHPVQRGPGETPFGPTPYKRAIAEAESEPSDKNTETEKALKAEFKELSPDVSTSAMSAQQKAQARLGGLEERERIGETEQSRINEDERAKQLYPLQERETVLRRQGLESQGGIEAAAQELAARRRENQFIQSQQVPGGGGQGTGLLGLLGSLINKAGGGPGGGTMGSPGGTSGGGAFGGKAGAAPSGPQVPRGGAPMPPQRPMTPMQFGQGGAPTPPVRPPGIGAAPQTAMRQERSPSQWAPPGYQGAAGQAAQNIPTPPVRPPGIGAAPQVPTVREAIGAAAQHPIMNVPINQVPAALEQLLGPGRSPPPGTSGSVPLGGAQTYPQGPYPPGPMRPQGPLGSAQAAPSMTPGGPAPGAAQPGAYGPQAPPTQPPSAPAQAAAPYSPPYGEPGGPGSAILGGRGNIAPGSAGADAPGFAPPGGVSMPRPAPPIPRRPDLAYPQGPYPGGPRPQGPPGPPGDNRNILGAILPLQRAQQRPQGPYGALVAPTEPPQGPYGSLMATAAAPSISPRQFAPSGGVSMPGQAPQGPYGALTPQQAPQFPQQAQVPQQAPGFHPIRGEVGDLPSSYRAAIGGGAVSPYQPMPPRRPQAQTPQPPPRPQQFAVPQAGAAGGGVSPQAQPFTRGSPDPGVMGEIRAAARGDPAIEKLMTGIYAGESGHIPGHYDTNITAREESYGPFQLNRKGGLGADFEKDTGLRLSDPSTRAAQADWVARKLKANPGLVKQFYGYRDRGRAMVEKGWGRARGGARVAGFRPISGEASDIPGIGGAADRASGAGRALSPEALAAPLPLRSAATNVRQLNPGLLSAVTSGANRFMADNPGYKVRVNEGFNTQGHTKFSHHHNGTAMDIQVIGPDGKDIPNRGNDPTGIYRKLASSVYGSAPAGVKEKLGWGGAFETSPGSGTQDLMHFDLGGDRGNLAPSFRLAALGGGEGGATPAAMAGGETPSATTETSETPEADRQQAREPSRQQQAYQPPPPPEMPEEPPPRQQAPWQPQQPIAAAPGRQRPQLGPPTVHDEREIAGMKPGSIFRTPDGRLKVVPIPARPQQASYASQ